MNSKVVVENIQKIRDSLYGYLVIDIETNSVYYRRDINNVDRAKYLVIDLMRDNPINWDESDIEKLFIEHKFNQNI